jgi:hypothetical protein
MAYRRTMKMIFLIIIGILMGTGLSITNAYSNSTGESSGYQIFLPMASNPLIPTVFGVESTDFSTTDRVEIMIQGGTTWVRYNNLLWSDLQPEENKEPDWLALEPFKQLLASIKNKQVNFILVVRDTPSWAQKYPGSVCGPISENKLPAFGKFMHDLVLQFSSPPYSVKYWELGNEPDTDVRFNQFNVPFGCWGESGKPYYGGDYYAQMLKQVYPSIKSADPNAKVLIGGLLLDCDPDHPVYDSTGHLKDCSSSRFLEGILAGGGGNYFDAVSYHAYDYYYDLGDYRNPNWNATSYSTGPTSIMKDQFVRSLLINKGYPGKLLLNTETAVLCAMTSCSNDNLIRDNFETTKAYYIAVDYASAIANGVTVRTWYSIDGWRYSRLIENNVPLPAYYAYKVASDELGFAKYGNELNQFNGVKGYQFTQGNRVIWFLWSIDGRDHTVQLPSAPILALDSLGSPSIPNQFVTVDVDPHYFEWIGNP